MAAGASYATTPIVPPAPAPVAVAPPAPNPVTREADAEAQFHVMAGEMAADRNQPGIAASEFIAALQRVDDADLAKRSEEHTSELQSLMRNSYAVFCLKKKNTRESYEMSI